MSYICGIQSGYSDHELGRPAGEEHDSNPGLRCTDETEWSGVCLLSRCTREASPDGTLSRGNGYEYASHGGIDQIESKYIGRSPVDYILRGSGRCGRGRRDPDEVRA